MALVHDILARLMQRVIGPRAASLPPHLRFLDIPRRCRAMRIPTSFGAADVTVYSPPPAAKPMPVHINFHGGGYVMGHPEQDDPFCAFLAENANVHVVNVDYLLAPQHRFPAAVEQCYEVLLWIAAHAAESGWDMRRLTVGGQSAGAGLAAAISLMTADRNGPPIGLQLLHYPPLDLHMPPDRKTAKAVKPIIAPPAARLFNAVYTPDPAMRQDMRASPLVGAPDHLLSKVAPAVVIAAELDLLRDEAAAYAARLERVDRLAEYIEVAGQDHAYNLRDAPRAVVEPIYRRMAAHVAAVPPLPGVAGASHG